MHALGCAWGVEAETRCAGPLMGAKAPLGWEGPGAETQKGGGLQAYLRGWEF